MAVNIYLGSTIAAGTEVSSTKMDTCFIEQSKTKHLSESTRDFVVFAQLDYVFLA